MWYALPTDDVAPTATAITASAEDPGYPADLLVDANPAHPAKLTTTSGDWVLEFASPIAPVAAVLVYPQLDAGLAVSLQGNSSDSWGAPAFSQAVTIPGPQEDGASISPILEITGTPSYPFWRLAVTGSNSVPVAVGRLMLLAALRTFEDGTSARWGLVENEDYGIVEMATELGVETIYDVGNRRRSLEGELLLRQLGATQFLTLRRATKGRVEPWLLVPFEDVNDAYLVRWSERASVRQLQVPEIPDYRSGYVQLLQLRVTEVSRGLPWP
jgi:hypothetical protein